MAITFILFYSTKNARTHFWGVSLNIGAKLSQYVVFNYINLETDLVTVSAFHIVINKN